MTDLRFSAELVHPPSLVWPALIEPGLLGEWFGQTDGGPGDGRFLLRLDDLVAGPIEVETVEMERPQRLLMRWQGEHLQVRVGWELTGIALGCQLDIEQSGFLGHPAAEMHQRWQQGYASRFGRLPAVLARLAAERPQLAAEQPQLAAEPPGSLIAAIAAIEQIDNGTAHRPVVVPRQRVAPESLAEPLPSLPEPPPPPPVSVDAPRDPGDEPVLEPVPPVSVDPPRDPGGEPVLEPAPLPVTPVGVPTRRRRGPWRAVGLALGMGVSAVAGATVAVVFATRPADVPGRVESMPQTAIGPAATVDPEAGLGPNGSPSPGRSPGGTSPTGRTNPGGIGPPDGTQASTPPAPPVRPTLRASYTVERIGLLTLTGYKINVLVTNPGTVAVDDWQATFTLRKGQTAVRVSGAQYRQEGTTVTFTPSAGASVPAGGSVTFFYEVDGLLAGEPTACTIDGHPCG